MKTTKYLLPLSFLMVAFYACKNTEEPVLYKPYVFSTRPLDSLVKLKQVILDQIVRPDGSLEGRKYYMGDTVKYHVSYNKRGNILSVTKFEGPKEVWIENYFPNGQRMSHYERDFDKKTGQTYFQGMYESYYESGWLQESGEYEMDRPKWIVKFTESGLEGDTLIYEYNNEIKTESGSEGDTLFKDNSEKKK
jgi:hypothetical protein